MEFAKPLSTTTHRARSRAAKHVPPALSSLRPPQGVTPRPVGWEPEMAAPKPHDGAEPVRLALSVDEAAYALGVSRAWLYRCALQTGQLASVHLGRRVVIPIAALHVYLEAHLSDPLDTLAATGGLSGAIATPAAVRPAIRAR